MITMLKRLVVTGCVALLMSTTGVALAQTAPTLGRDFTMINPPQPTDSGKKIEVVEFFWLSP